MPTLRELIAAWQIQGPRCLAAFDQMNVVIKQELGAVGGFATTRPNGEGYCQDFVWDDRDDSFFGGVMRAGTVYGGTGPRAAITAPHHPDVGDRCFVAEQAWRKEAMALTAAAEAVREYIQRHADGSGPEHVAALLAREDEASYVVRTGEDTLDVYTNGHPHAYTATYAADRLRERVTQLEAELKTEMALHPPQALTWDDTVDEWSVAIRASHPSRSGAHDEYGTAMKMISSRRSKGELIALVTWLLTLVHPAARPASGR